MTHRLLKASECYPSAGFRVGGVALLSGALLAASSGLAPLAAQQAWTASVETQAETAYRAIEARSFAKPKPPGRTVRRKRAVAEPVQTSPIVPDLPERNMTAPAEVTGADKPATDVFASDAPKAQPSIEAAAFAEPQMRNPNGLADVLTTQVVSEEEAAAAAASAEPEPVPQTTGDQYCSSIANAAADARFAWQKQTLVDTEKQVEGRVEELNVKIAEYQKWMARRDEFSRKAQSIITDIYTKMKPDAAAQQLSALDEETAAAVIVKLSPKISSALMAEMEAKKGARLTSIISSSSKGPKGKLPAAAPPPPPPSGGT
jgi:flagellar motility protein MotE (MotC chaperone)